METRRRIAVIAMFEQKDLRNGRDRVVVLTTVRERGNHLMSVFWNDGNDSRDGHRGKGVIASNHHDRMRGSAQMLQRCPDN